MAVSTTLGGFSPLFLEKIMGCLKVFQTIPSPILTKLSHMTFIQLTPMDKELVAVTINVKVFDVEPSKALQVVSVYKEKFIEEESIEFSSRYSRWT